MYKIVLSEAGKEAYPNRDQNLERLVEFLIERMGASEWEHRKRAIHDRLAAKLKRGAATSPEGISLRDRDDEIAWYLHLGEQTIADPPSIDADQAARILPYLSALGRKLDAVRKIDEVDARLDELLRKVANRDPDQALFELLVGASYVEEGWHVTALSANSQRKMPDFEVTRAGKMYQVECKRLTRRPEYTEKERDAWLKLWQPASRWLVENRISLIWTVVLHEEIRSYPPTYLLDIVRTHTLYFLNGGEEIRDAGRSTITAKSVDYAAISSVCKDYDIKCGSSRERELITGCHQPDFGLTYSIGGVPCALGSAAATSNKYWDSIQYVSGAYWRCDAPAAIDAKARDILKRLAEANEQLSSSVPGIVHIGIETADGDDVELVRSEKILNTLRTFNPRGKRLEWLYLHFFRGESPPDGMWAVDETCQRFGIAGPPSRPLKADLLLGTDDVPTYQRAHWEPVKP